MTEDGLGDGRGRIAWEVKTKEYKQREPGDGGS